MQIPLLNIWVLWVSVYVILAIGFSSLVWCTHLYTYAPKAKRPPNWREFREGGGFWKIIRRFKVYCAEEGKLLGEARALRGLTIGCGFSFIILLAIFLILAVSGMGFRPIRANAVWIYSAFLFIVASLGFPFLFCFKARLPKRVFWSIPEAPYSLIWWGFLISIYGAAVLIRYTMDIDIVSIADEKHMLPFSLTGAPFFWFTTIIACAAVFLKPVKVPHNTTWFLFALSWAIGGVACYILALAYFLR